MICNSSKINAAEVKQAAAGRWPEILSHLAGIAPEILDGQHHPCPRCGGEDRFRLIDAEAGAVLCNQCFNESNGDGFAALSWLTGNDFPATVRSVAAYLGLALSSNGHHGNGRTPRKTKAPASPAVFTNEIVPISGVAKVANTLRHFAKAKPPITLEGIERCGGTAVRWHGCACIQFEGRAPIDAKDPTAIVLVKFNGRPFPAVGNVAERKSHATKGSINSWLVCGDVATAETIFDCEGVTDLLAVASAGLPAGWVGVTNTSGAKARGKLPREWAANKRIIVAGDADQAGVDGQQRAAVAYVKAGAAEVRLGQLPYPVEADHGKDLRDWLLEGHTIDELPTVAVTAEEVAAWAKQKQRKSNTGREIIVSTDESRVIDEAIDALATRENVFQRGGAIVQVVEGTKPPKGIARPEDAPRISPMRYPRIREHLADAAAWLRPAGEGELEQVHPPDWCVKAIDARGQWPSIRRLEAVVESPILRADGSVLQQPGYDVETGIVFRPQCSFPEIPKQPTRDDAIRARDALLEVVVDFPFANDAHRAAWVAGVLTPLARYAFFGPAPLTMIDANVRGCGKSLLSDATALLTTGREMSRMSLPHDDDEIRKRITAIALAGEPLALIDNISGTLGSSSLDAALTATSWSDRILGQSAMASAIPLYVVWYATGNNIVLAADTARRVVHVRLESPEENPEERSGFHHADLLGWIRRERPRLTAAAITILAGYCAAGRPGQGLTPWGSFEGWSDLVRSAAVWVGLADPGESRTDLASTADREAVALRQLLEGWAEVDPYAHGMTVADVLREMADHPLRYDVLRAALHELAPPRDGKSLNARSIGMKLHHVRRRVVGGRCLDNRQNNRGTALWLVQDAGTKGSKGTNLTPSRARAHAHAHTQEPQVAGNSPFTTFSPAACEHGNVEETPTSDGYVNRQCRDCGADLPCRKAEEVNQ